VVAELPGSGPPVAGSLLVATPWLDDPNFRRTVIYLLEHSDAGTLGVVLNRASELTVAETVGEWAPLVCEPPVVFVGGPVAPQAVVALGQVGSPAPSDGWSALPGGLAAVDINRPAAELDGSFDRLRLFAGYAGWGPRQLEAEMAERAWWVFGARIEDIFSSEAEELWRAVLIRQRKPWRVFAEAPDDPSVN